MAIYAAIIGILLGVSDTSVPEALVVLFGLVLAHALWTIAVRKRFITGAPSQYDLYLEKLHQSGNQTAGAWRTFLLLSLLTDGGVGAISFAITRVLSSS